MKKEILLALITGKIAEMISLAQSFNIQPENFAFDGKMIGEAISKEKPDSMVIRGLVVSLKSNVALRIPSTVDQAKTEEYYCLFGKAIEAEQLVVAYCETILENKNEEENNGR